MNGAGKSSDRGYLVCPKEIETKCVIVYRQSVYVVPSILFGGHY